MFFSFRTSPLYLLFLLTLTLQAKEPKLNVLLFTADDLHRESLACFGGQVSDLTPNLDQFAGEGMRFYRAHVNAAICVPSRAILATGLYGHNSGAMGFMKAKESVPTVNEIFREAGYNIGILGKVSHSTPGPNSTWDYSFDQADLGDGRSPQIYYEKSVDFFKQCKEKKQAFYFMVNSHDPHRPFQIPNKLSKGAEAPSRYYNPDEVEVPGFVPDLENVRLELSYYQNSVRRLDDTFGKVMQALEESGMAEHTIVMFLADNGIAIPFAKCNTYLASTRTPWIVRWPKVVEANSENKLDFISGIDFLPTVLEAANIPLPSQLDGRSFIPLLKGQAQEGRKRVFTQIDSKAGNAATPMRCIQNGKYGYVFNAWSDGQYWYRNNNEGIVMKAMQEAAKEDPDIKARIKLFRYRELEELFDLEKDPDCLTNLIHNPEYEEIKLKLSIKLYDWMQKTNDPLLPAFRNRHHEQKRKAALEKVYGPPKDESPAAKAKQRAAKMAAQKKKRQEAKKKAKSL